VIGRVKSGYSLKVDKKIKTERLVQSQSFETYKQWIWKQILENFEKDFNVAILNGF